MYREECERNPYGLTDAQVQTITMIANGYTQAQVATFEYIALSTVKERLTMIRSKMDCDSTLQAAVMWVREVENA